MQFTLTKRTMTKSNMAAMDRCMGLQSLVAKHHAWIIPRDRCDFSYIVVSQRDVLIVCVFRSLFLDYLSTIQWTLQMTIEYYMLYVQRWPTIARSRVALPVNKSIDQDLVYRWHIEELLDWKVSTCSNRQEILGAVTRISISILAIFFYLDAT